MTIEEKITYLRENCADNVPISVAAEMLGKPVVFVRESLKDGSYPFGCALKRDGWSFSIPTERFIAYLTGADMLTVSKEDLLSDMRETFEKVFTESKAQANQAV